MSDRPTLLYLEADDEITAVVRRLRAADPGRVVVVAPGRSRATSSAVALRLLARAAEADGRPLAIVGDPLTRSLAAEAGIAAFASVEEARRADPSAAPAAPASGVPHATIHVVRGPATEDSAPTLATAAVGRGSDDVTRPVPVARRPRRPAQARRRPARAIPAALLGGLVLLLAGAVVAAAVVMPAATITITRRADPIGPYRYTITVPAEREAGTVEETATVTATGTYTVQEAATGTVVFFNWTFFPVAVPAGTFVAAGEQAFATQADVVVPRGRLTAQGRIAAGDASVAVEAAAPGPAANVGADKINRVLDEGIDDRLGGVPENPEPRVLNPEPTSGGVDETGPEITQEDVDLAVQALREQLVAAADEASAGETDEIRVAAERPEPVLSGIDELAGTRDQAEAEISGELAWSVLRVRLDAVERAAIERLPEVATDLPEAHEIVPGSEDVRIGEAAISGEALEVDVRVEARATAPIDEGAVRERAAGRSAEAAAEALADLGAASVELWPGWAATVPEWDWRVDVRVEEPPGASASPEASP
ncbi:MAG TPA: hypothetical protein VHR55_04625 [Candidatus Limnocylindria bacterium]|nr:hypothetical protein [Candidatus Limnocylindria bacterium]